MLQPHCELVTVRASVSLQALDHMLSCTMEGGTQQVLIGLCRARHTQAILHACISMGAALQRHAWSRIRCPEFATPASLQVKGEAEIVRRVLRDLTSILRACGQSRPSDLVRLGSYSGTSMLGKAIASQDCTAFQKWAYGYGNRSGCQARNAC